MSATTCPADGRQCDKVPCPMACNPARDTVPSTKPAYSPPIAMGVWLSSEEVKAAIERVGMRRSEDIWRACCWELNAEINKLSGRSQA